jgi:hypothetical protein
MLHGTKHLFSNFFTYCLLYFSISILIGMKKYYKPKSKNNENERSSHLLSGGGVLAQKKTRVELNPSEVIADPKLHKPIDDYDKEIKDKVRRAYLLNGPT